MHSIPFAQRKLRLSLAAIAVSVPLAALAATPVDTASANAYPGNATATRSAPMQDSRMPGASESLWTQLDTNHDGVISRTEFMAAHTATTAASPADAQRTGDATGIALQTRMRASDLIGTEVRNPQGDDLGEIHDLLVDVNSGRVQGAVLSFGGFMGVGDKLFRYPLSSFRQARNDDSLVLDVSEKSLERANGFDRDRWPDWITADEGKPGAARKAGVWRASRLIGKDVNDRRGEHLGEIADLVINTRQAKVDTTMLRYDRPWSLDNPLVAMPLASFNFGDGRHDVSMNLDKSDIDTRTADAGGVAPRHGNVLVERWIFLAPTATATDANANGSASTSAGSQATGASDASQQASENPQTSDATTSATRSGPSDAMTSAASSGPSAESGSAPSAGTSFDQLDANHDGRLDRNEYRSGPEAASFSAADRNGDSGVSRDEYAQRQAAAQPQ